MDHAHFAVLVTDTKFFLSVMILDKEQRQIQIPVQAVFLILAHLDGVSYLSSAVMGITAKPTKMMMEWMNDQIAPAYWVPNAEIHACRSCTTFLSAPETKHHCRFGLRFL